jgi:hypothetical protein
MPSCPSSRQVTNFVEYDQGLLAYLRRPSWTVSADICFPETRQTTGFCGPVAETPGGGESGVKDREEVGHSPVKIEEGHKSNRDLPTDWIVVDCCGLSGYRYQVRELGLRPVRGQPRGGEI